MQPLQIGVCNWSLQIPDFAQCMATIKTQLGLGLVQIGWWDEGFKNIDTVRQAIGDNGLEVSATCLGFEGEDYSSIQSIAQTGGFKPDALWDARFAKTRAFADFTKQMGVKLLATHIGFVPHDRSDAAYGTMVDRLRKVCDELGERGITLVMETGQESAYDLLDFIAAVGRDNIAVNFDPANMILYGVGEPLEAVTVLRDKINHVHMKDAVWSATPRESWGEEVVLGTGDAEIPRIVSKLRAGGYTGPLVIEREAGSSRAADIQEGIDLLQSLLD